MPIFARIAAAVAALVVLLSLASAGQSQSQSTTPGQLTTGAAPVQVVNDVKALAAQAGEWQVSLAPRTTVALVGDTTVSVAPPEFLRVGQRYLVRPAGESPAVCLVDRLDHGWVHVAGPAGPRWLNLGQIVSIREQ